MAQVLRGEIYWANLEPVLGHEQGGGRPVLIISHDVFNDRSGTVIVMAITSQPQRAGPPLAYRLAPGGPSEAVLGQDLADPHDLNRASPRSTGRCRGDAGR